MSLKARIRGLEAKVEWLERWGELRKVEQALKYRASVKKIVDYLTANPKVAVRLGIADQVRAQPEHLDLADAPPEPQPPEPLPEDSAPSPALPPKPEVWTHDPPEHMQIEKVTWRMRGPQDDLDDEEDEYDVLRDA
jgi:hypothetical protein